MQAARPRPAPRKATGPTSRSSIPPTSRPATTPSRTNTRAAPARRCSSTALVVVEDAQRTGATTGYGPAPRPRRQRGVKSGGGGGEGGQPVEALFLLQPLQALETAPSRGCRRVPARVSRRNLSPSSPGSSIPVSAERSKHRPSASVIVHLARRAGRSPLSGTSLTRRQRARILGRPCPPRPQESGLRASRQSASATEKGMLYCASIRSAGSTILWRSTMRGVPVTVIASISAPVKPCSACRSRTALTAACAVASHGIAFQHRGRDDKLLAEAAGQLGPYPISCRHLEKPEFAFQARCAARRNRRRRGSPPARRLPRRAPNADA